MGLGDVNEKKVQGWGFKVQRLNKNKGVKQICKAERWNVIIYRPDKNKCNRDFIGQVNYYKKEYF